MPKNVEKMSLNYSPNFDLKKRSNSKVKYLIFHYTGMSSETAAIKRLTNSKSKVSCHYFIKANGEIVRIIPDLYTAWHAGISSWKKDKYLNSNSIGIEISNPGHKHGYKNYNLKQINSIIRLSKKLKKKYKIKFENVLGHSDIAPLRKIDPGEKFPWKLLSKKKIGIWHYLNTKALKSLRGKKSEFKLKQFIIYLNNVGYHTKFTNLNELKKIIKIFQMKFRPELVDGKLDLETYNIAKSLYKHR